MYADTIIDQSHNLAKQALYAVPHAGLREELTKVVNAQAEFARTVCSSFEKVGQIFTEEVRKGATSNAFTK